LRAGVELVIRDSFFARLDGLVEPQPTTSTAKLGSFFLSIFGRGNWACIWRNRARSKVGCRNRPSRFVFREAKSWPSARYASAKRKPSAPFVDQVERIGGIAQRLRHFAALLSATDPVKKTVVNGILSWSWPFFPVEFRPAMIMRATQKKMMSGPVTSTRLGKISCAFSDPSSRRPKPGRKPGIQRVGILNQFSRSDGGSTPTLTWDLECGV